MKKLQYIIAPFMAAAVLVACNNEPQGPTQAELDAQVEAKVEEVKTQLKADCDAKLMQAATAIKDSMLMSAAATPATAAKPAAPAKATTKPTPKPTTTGVQARPAAAGLRSYHRAGFLLLQMQTCGSCRQPGPFPCSTRAQVAWFTATTAMAAVMMQTLRTAATLASRVRGRRPCAAASVMFAVWQLGCAAMGSLCLGAP